VSKERMGASVICDAIAKCTLGKQRAELKRSMIDYIIIGLVLNYI